MQITRKSSFTGKTHTMDLNVTPEQMERYENKEDYIQNIFPNLPVEQREFIKTGITPQEWNDQFGEE